MVLVSSGLEAKSAGLGHELSGLGLDTYGLGLAFKQETLLISTVQSQPQSCDYYTSLRSIV